MSDSDLDAQFPSLAYHQYCAKDMANCHRNIGSIALVRATFATTRSLRPCANTTQLRHIHELSTVASPMCSRARLVALPIAFPQNVVCPLVLLHTLFFFGPAEDGKGAEVPRQIAILNDCTTIISKAEAGKDDASVLM